MDRSAQLQLHAGFLCKKRSNRGTHISDGFTPDNRMLRVF